MRHDIRHDITTKRSCFLQVISKPFANRCFFSVWKFLLSGNIIWKLQQPAPSLETRLLIKKSLRTATARLILLYGTLKFSFCQNFKERSGLENVQTFSQHLSSQHSDQMYFYWCTGHVFLLAKFLSGITHHIYIV